MSRPALPPRRTATLPDNETEYKPMGIAARIASMQLDHVGRTKPSVPIRSAPPIPARKAVPTSPTRRTTQDELVTRGDDYLRLISRRPPPPPTKNKNAPAPPSRRLPPMPTRLPTPPPEPEEEEEPDEDEEQSCLKCHDFSVVDGHAAQFPRDTVDSLDQLAYDLTAPWQSETEKFRAIFTWLHHNIAYVYQLGIYSD